MRKIFIPFLSVMFLVVGCGTTETETSQEDEIDHPKTNEAQTSEPEPDISEELELVEQLSDEQTDEVISDETDQQPTEDGETTDSEDQTNEPEEDVISHEPSNIDVEQLLLQSHEAMRFLTSMAVSINSERMINDNGSEYNNVTTIDGEISFKNPTSMHQLIVVEADGDQNEVEMYRSKDKMYITNSTTDEWAEVVMDQQGEEQMLMMDPAMQFVGISSLNDSFQVNEEGNEYIITFKGDDSEFQSLLWEATKLNEDAVSKRYYESNYDSFDFTGTYEFRINKETFYITSIQLDYESKLEAEFSETTIKETMDVNYHHFNEYDKITIPDDVINNSRPLGGS